MKRTLPLLIAALAGHSIAVAESQVPTIISYQGHVTTASGVPVGASAPVNRSITFRFWNHPTNTASSSRLYTEVQTVTMLEGNFSVLLGNGTAVEAEPNASVLAEVFSSKDVFLGVTVDDGDPTTEDPEMLPRQQIATTAFAFRAKLAEVAQTTAASAVTNSMLASDSVATLQLQNNAVVSGKIAAGAVTTDRIAAGAVTTDQIAAGAVTLDDIVASVKQALCPVGTVLTYTGDTAPEGWLMCHGAAISRADYSALYAVIGNRFGYGNGDTTFHIPDFRGKFLRGRDAGAGYDPDRNSRGNIRTGGATGDSVGSFQSDEFRSHTHSEYTMTNNGYGTDPGGYHWHNSVTPTTTSATGGNETRPVNIYVNYIIKY
ncbi:tail fiber protein [Opitutales bacterium]|nr:tail fiber protein [Opitutales bacterium]